MKTGKNFLRASGVAVFIAAALAVVADPDPVYVDSVAALTNAVKNATDGTTIRLAAGTYRFEDEWMNINNSITNLLYINAKNVTIEGETATSRRTWPAGSEPVIIDGNRKGRIAFVSKNKTGATFKNITFIGGDVNSNRGGGVGCDNSFLAICTNCVFRGNYAGNGNGGSAALWCELRDCLVAGNLEGPALGTCNAYGCDIVGNPYGAARYTSMYDCGVSNNVITVTGSGRDIVSTGDASYSTTLSGCIFRYNSCDRYIASNVHFMTNCIFECNTNTYGNGTQFSGIAVTNCVFRQNNATGSTSYLAGGITSLSGCVFEENRAGLGCLNLNANGLNTVVDGCTFKTNVAFWNGSSTRSYGAAIRITRTPSALCTMMVTNCTFAGNDCNFRGGAICVSNTVPNEAMWTACTVVDSVFTDNTANHAAGVYGVHAIDCTFRGNVKKNDTGNNDGNAAAFSYLERCTFNDADLASCTVANCRIFDVRNTKCIFSGSTHVTNTIVESCPLKVQDGALLSLGNLIDAEFVNCTFVRNNMRTYRLGNGSYKLTNSVSFVNCLFNGNTNIYYAADFDVHRSSDNKSSDMLDYVSFVNTYIGCLDPYVTSRNYFDYEKFHAKMEEPDAVTICADPKFAGKDSKTMKRHPNEPYWALSLKSPLLGKGRTHGWMNDALDLAGRPRVREGKVDVGCYECWLSPPGLNIIIR